MFSALKSALLPPALVVIGAFFIFTGFKQGQDAKALADHGKTAEAIVDQVEWKEKKLSGREKGFKIDIHFETEDKKTINAKVSVSAEMGKHFRDTDANTIQIKYLPENPQTIVLADAKDDSAASYGIGGALIVGGAAVFLFRRRKS